MSVNTIIARASFGWTGAQTTFAAGFPALERAHVVVTHTPTGGATATLTLDLHYAVDLAPTTRIVTVRPLPAFPATFGTVEISRRTPTLQPTSFRNADAFDASLHERLHDQHALATAELRELADRAPRVPSGSAGYELPPASPANDEKFLQIKDGKAVAASASDAGLAVLAQTQAARDTTLVYRDTTLAYRDAAQVSAAAAAADAALLENLDLGPVAEIVTQDFDLGTIP